MRIYSGDAEMKLEIDIFYSPYISLYYTVSEDTYGVSAIRPTKLLVYMTILLLPESYFGSPAFTIVEG